MQRFEIIFQSTLWLGFKNSGSQVDQLVQLLRIVFVIQTYSHLLLILEMISLCGSEFIWQINTSVWITYNTNNTTRPEKVKRMVNFAQTSD